LEQDVAPAPVDPDLVARLLREALARRAALLEAEYPVRLFDRAGDGLSRLVVEKFGDAWRVSGGPEKAALLPVIREVLGNPPALYYRFGHEATGGPDDGVRVVREDGLDYEVALLPNRNTGLFLEARPARRWVRENSEGRRVLNLFAYTCAFGVAAAAGGARATVNVDTVPSALERGRRNYELNGLRVDGRSFWRSDVREALRRARKSGAAFDGIVLHPPPVETAGRRERRTDAVRDLEAMTTACRQVLAPGGWLLLAWTPPLLADDELHAAVGLGGPVWTGGCGEDFRCTPEQPGLRCFAYPAGR
jgi:23S rRNA G2069 N7-methylase RlmK/C1962 C5-methylase RlmI